MTTFKSFSALAAAPAIAQLLVAERAEIDARVERDRRALAARAAAEAERAEIARAEAIRTARRVERDRRALAASADPLTPLFPSHLKES